jgi:hypothetical protein
MAACPRIRGNVTDRAHRYRAVRNAPEGEKRCLFCGSTRNVEVGHLDGHEEHGEPENLVWTCRSCNVVAANTLKNARMGRATHQFNPTKSGGASNVGEWAQAVGAIIPRAQDGSHKFERSPYRNEGLQAGSTMSTSDAVAMIRATSPAKRREFAAALGRHGYSRRASKKSAEWWAENPAASYTLHPQYRDSKHDKWAHTGHKEQRVTGTLTDAQRAARDFVSSMAGKEAIERPHMTEREFRVKVFPEGSYDEAAIVGQPRRVNPPSRKRANLFGFGSKKKTAVKRSSMTVSSASSAAYKAGQQSGDTGLFRTWAESKGLSDRGPWLRKQYDKGVNDGERAPQRGTSKADVSKARAAYSKMMAKAKEARTVAKEGGGYASIPSESAIAKAYQDGAKNLTEALAMAGARPNPSTPAGEMAAAQRFMAQAQTARLAGDLTRASSLERLARSRAAMAQILAGQRPNGLDWGTEGVSDLAKQGFMKPRKSKTVTLYEAWTPHGVTYTGENRYTAEAHVRQYGGTVKEKRGQRPNPQHRKRAKRNSADASDQAYESFHGQPVGETVLVSDDLHEHEHLWTLGLLMEMRVDTMSGFECLLNFEDDPPYLCSSEDGKQLYIEAGDQKLDLKALKLDGAEWRKDRMVIGQLSPPGKDRAGKPVKWNIGYQTEKDFDKFETILYQHDHGEETGVRPFLEYEPRNEKLYISGGQYKIKLPLFGTSPGIEN